MSKIKKVIKEVIFSNKITANIYYNKQYGNGMNDDFLLSKIQQIAHRFDHRFMGGYSIVRKDIYEFEYLLNIAKDRGLKFEDSLMSALGLYAMAKLNADNCYNIKKVENNEATNTSNISNIIKERRSVRKWTNDVINLELIKIFIETSLWAPSSCNRQPVRVIILDDKQKDFIKNYFPGTFWHTAPVQLLVLCNYSAYSANEIFFPYLDGSAFIQNMLLLLHEAGFGGCWLGFKKWNTKCEIFCDKKVFDEFYEYFNINTALVPISLVVAGKYELVPKSPPRQSLDVVIIGGVK